MTTVNSLIFNHWDRIGITEKKVIEWEPQPNNRNEADLEKHLTAHLKQCFSKLQIRNQFPYDRLIADIVIEKKLAIELKRNLQSTNELNRLLGQIDQYHEWGISLIVVVVGSCPDDFIHKVKRKLSLCWDNDEACLITK